MNWETGKARCRSDEYEAEILATDMGGETPLLVRYKRKHWKEWASDHFRADGRFSRENGCGFDLLPPRLSLEEAAEECNEIYCRNPEKDEVDAMLAALQHYEKMKAEGRV